VEIDNLSGNQPAKMNYFVDANSGEILHQFNALPTLMPTGTVNGTVQDSTTGSTIPLLGSTGVSPSTATGNRNPGVVPPWVGNSNSFQNVMVAPRRGRVMPDGRTAPARSVWGSQMGGVSGKVGQAAATTVNGSASPNAPIQDFQTTTSSINIPDNVNIT